MLAAPGVHWLRMPLPFALDHINLWLIEDGDGYTAVDTGYGTAPTHALWEKVLDEAIARAPIRRIIVTHYHPDHLGAAAWLAARCGAKVYMTRTEYETGHAVRHAIGGWSRATAMAYLVGHGLDQTRLAAQETRGNAYARGVPELPAEYETIAEGDRLTIGARTWRVMVVRGHAPEHAALYCEQDGILISGDQVLPRISTNVSVWGNQPDGNPLALFLDSLARLKAELPPDTRILPSHGLVFHGLHTRIEQLQSHHVERLAHLEAALSGRHTAAELVPVLFPRALDDHQLMFAIGETIAHLNYLIGKGRARRETGSDGVVRFERAIAAG